MGQPRTIDDRFVIEKPAAAGGMGTVYRGRDLAGGEVAIKVLHRSGVGDHERFRREATVLAGLDHPAIVKYVAHGELDDGSPYLVMEWIEGETLDARMRGAGLTIEESVKVVRQVASALAFAHERGLVHRDIKPSNLILRGGDLDRAAVIDFGVARPVAMSGSLTDTGAVVGTPSYMAPEQVRAERNLGPACDVFALGCVLYECLTGRLAFEGLRFLALSAKILLWDPPPVRSREAEVSPELDALVMQMIAKDATARPADGAAVVAALDALPPPPPSTTPRRARRHTDGATQVSRPPHRVQKTGVGLVSIVVATTPDALDAAGAATMTVEDLGTLAGSLERSVKVHGAEIDVLRDGALIATLSGVDDAAELARRAVKCALAVRAQLPAALIAVSTGPAHDSEQADLIEQAVDGLAKDAIAVAFSTVPAGAIRIDARTAGLIEQEYALFRVKGVSYLS